MRSYLISVIKGLAGLYLLINVVFFVLSMVLLKQISSGEIILSKTLSYPVLDFFVLISLVLWCYGLRTKKDEKQALPFKVLGIAVLIIVLIKTLYI